MAETETTVCGLAELSLQGAEGVRQTRVEGGLRAQRLPDPERLARCHVKIRLY
jgi:hypothetical protein